MTAYHVKRKRPTAQPSEFSKHATGGDDISDVPDDI